MSYLLNGTIRSVKTFQKRGARLNDTNDQRQQVAYASNQSMNLIVTSPMPLIEVKSTNFPKTLLAGEVKKAIITITNKGQKALVGLRVRLSHPSFIFFGKKEDLEQDVYQHSGVESVPAISKMESPNHLSDPTTVNLHLPEHNGTTCLPPGDTIQVPVWIRGDRAGSFNFQFLFSYEAEVYFSFFLSFPLCYWMTTFQSNPNSK
jgi:hypothetical protein